MWAGVFAVVITYNRKELVAQCLKSIFAQTVTPERIVVVDNGASDGTGAFLAAQGLLEDERVDYLRLEHNTGAAGGLRAGIGHAYAQGCAWVWVMDDDVICLPDTLAGLKAAYEANFAREAQLGFLVSRLVGPDGRGNNMPHIDDGRDIISDCVDWSERLARGLVRLRISTLTSILLPRSTLTEFGAPLSDFFIWGEDTDYTLRVTARKPGYLVGRSTAVHLRGVAGDLDILNETTPERIRNFYFLYRNTVYLRRVYWPRYALYLYFVKAAMQLCRAVASRDQRLRRAWTILSGVGAGLFFRPRSEPLIAEPSAAEPQAAAEPPSAVRRVPVAAKFAS